MEDKKQRQVSVGFIMDLEYILNYLSENDIYMAQIGKTNIRYIGETENTASGKRQVFEIERKVE